MLAIVPGHWPVQARHRPSCSPFVPPPSCSSILPSSSLLQSCSSFHPPAAPSYLLHLPLSFLNFQGCANFRCEFQLSMYELIQLTKQDLSSTCLSTCTVYQTQCSVCTQHVCHQHVLGGNNHARMRMVPNTPKSTERTKQEEWIRRFI